MLIGVAAEEAAGGQSAQAVCDRSFSGPEFSSRMSSSFPLTTSIPLASRSGAVNSNSGAGPCIVILCAGPSLERLRPLKKCLEDCGATVRVRTDLDLIEGNGISACTAATRDTCSTASSERSLLEPRTPRRSCQPKSRTASEGQKSRSRSPERSASVAPEHTGERDLRSWSPHEAFACDALLVLWSQYFHQGMQAHLSELSKRASARGALLLNNVKRMFEMQDRRWVLRKLREQGVLMPHFVECSREGGQDPALEEHSDHILIGGQRIDKPFFEKPVDRRDREIYVYFPKEAGGGRALVSKRESGDAEAFCRWDPISRVRREGSFVYQEYTQSDNKIVHAVCCGGQAYGNAVQSGVITPPLSRSAASSCVASSSPLLCDLAGGASPVFLRQEEKVIAKKLSMIMHQTLFGITFARAQAGKKPGRITSYVIDVWPGVPRAGFGVFCEDIGRTLVAIMSRRLPAPINRMRARSQPRYEDEEEQPLPEAPARESRRERLSKVPSQCDEAEDTLCLLLLCRHGARTPKQKAKAKVKMPSEFAAGWLCGWLGGAALGAADATDPPLAFDLRAPDQLSRLNAAARKLQHAGHKLGTFADALANFGKLGEACHAKMGRDGHVLNVAMKWGGELTQAGIEASEAFGRAFRQETCKDIDVGSVRHDTKVYASSEPRCQQTAAAFCKGFLRLTTPALPPIIAALVRKDEVGSLDAGNGGKNYIGKQGGDDEEPTSKLTLESLEVHWEELVAGSSAATTKTAIQAAISCPALLPFTAPGPALRELNLRVERLLAALSRSEDGKDVLVGGLHNEETLGLLCERYKDTLKGLQLGETPRSFDKLSRILDQLEYDMCHNRAALPRAAQVALDGALPLCAALCDAQSALDVAWRSDPKAAHRDDTALQILHKLRWDLRVASGADLGDEKEHLSKHEYLYGSGGGSEKPCMRTRLYFCHNSHLEGLLIALAWPRAHKGHATHGIASAAHSLASGRLGFLAHFAVRLIRKRGTGELRVICQFARDDVAQKVCLFDLPLAEVDAWFAELLQDIEDPYPDHAPPKAPDPSSSEG